MKKMVYFKVLQLLLFCQGILIDTTQGHTIDATARTASFGYYIQQPSGSYRYAYNSGNGYAGQKIANQDNEDTGHYSFYEKGLPYTVKYSAGVQGYQPEILLSEFQASSLSSSEDQSAPNSLRFVQDALRTVPTQPLHISLKSNQAAVPIKSVLPIVRTQSAYSSSSNVQQTSKLTPKVPAQPYSFSYDTDLSAHSVDADNEGNVYGRYSYNDEAGYHELAYKAGSDGFKVLGGNLAQASSALTPATAMATQGVSYKYSVPHVAAVELPQTRLFGGSGATTLSACRSLRKFQRYIKW